MADEKPPMMEHATSSPAATLNEKTTSEEHLDEKHPDGLEGTAWARETTPTPPAAAVPGGTQEPDLAHVVSTQDAMAELNRVMTSGDGIEYPTGLPLTLVTIALCMSVFLMALDNTIIATAIPHITDQFHSLPDVGWYGSAYLLTTASFQLLFGKIYTFFSLKWVYLIAIAIFELGSLICGVAPNSVALIIGRAVAGIGSAGIFSGAMIIIAYSVPLAKRPMYTGFVGAMYGIASVAGPLLGGAFTDKATWRWCFYINLPIGGLTMLVIIIFFKSPERAAVASLGWKQRVKEFDLYGTATLIPAIICLLLALQWGGSTYAWKSGRIIALFVIFGVLITCFGFIQFWKGESATVPPSIMKNRSMAAASWFSFTLGSAFLLLVYYLPIWFQAVKGASAVRSGIMNIPMILTMVIASILAGIGVTTVGYYAPLMIASTILTSIGVGLMYTFVPGTGHEKWIGYQALTGIGIGLGLQQPLIAVQTVLPISKVPVGTSVIIFVQTLGGALFVSIGQNVFTNKLIEGLKEWAPDIPPTTILRIGATSIQQSIKDPAELAGVTHAYNSALTNAYLVAAAMATLTILGSVTIEWKSVKGKQIEAVAA